MTLWVAADALAGRREPDATVSPEGRIEPGVTLTELERLGAWVRVETPDGQRWWVDGRRLNRPDEPPPTTLPSLQSAGETEDRTGFAMRPRMAVLVAVVAVAAIAVIGGAALLFRGGETPPTIVRGRVDLGFEPQVVQSPTTSDLDLVVAGVGAVGTLSIVGPGEGDLWLTKYRTDGLVRAVVGGWGLPILLSASEIVEYGADGEVRTVALPADCCADVIAPGFLVDVVVFPEVGGVSRELWEISLDDGERVTYALPAPVEVTAVAEFDGYLYVGHTEGIVVLAPWMGCDEPLASWDIPTVALTIAMDDPPMVVGLNTAGSIFTLDPLGPFGGVSGCTDGIRIPQLTGSVPLREAGLDARDFRETLAVVGDAAYVIDTDGVVYVVDLARPDDDRDDRLIATIAVPEPRPGEGARLARLQSPGSGSPNVFVTDPDRGWLWWIAGSGDPSPFEVITPLSTGS